MKKFAKQYFDVLHGTELSGLNLSSLKTFNEFYNLLFLDSINSTIHSIEFKEIASKVKYVVDIGFGGGFPLVPLAKAMPSLNFIGIESKKKKVEAVKYILSNFPYLNNIQIINDRYENIIFNESVVIVSKAMCTVEKLLNSIKFTNPIYVFFYKGKKSYQSELSNLNIHPSWIQLPTSFWKLPNGAETCFIGFKNEMNEKQLNFPKYNMQNLVNISDLI